MTRLIKRCVYAALRQSVRRPSRPASRVSRPETETTGEYVPARTDWVLDGDTADVDIGRETVRIRLAGIDCPEDGQPWGDKAKFGLMKLISPKNILLEIHGEDDYGRTVATIHVRQENGELLNVNEKMVARGHAWVTRRAYDRLSEDRCRTLYRIQSWARSRKVGLWKTGNPVPPWEWRKQD